MPTKVTVFEFNPVEGERVIESRPHTWGFCSHCNGWMVYCGFCGNNCCNGGSGENCPDKCEEAYAIQKEYFNSEQYEYDHPTVIWDR